MRDILGAVNDFILAYVGYNEVPLLTQDQIVVGWQNVAAALPKNTQEYAVLTLLQAIRHGTNVRMRQNAEGDTGMVETIAHATEHIVQVDFCCASPQMIEEVARTRAEILETLTRDRVAVDFYKSYGMTSCYAEDVHQLPFQNESEQWEARYMVTLHLSGYTATNVDLKTFEAIDTFIECTDVHHPVKPEFPKENDYEAVVIQKEDKGYIHNRIQRKGTPVEPDDTDPDDTGDNTGNG